MCLDTGTLGRAVNARTDRAVYPISAACISRHARLAMMTANQLVPGLCSLPRPAPRHQGRVRRRGGSRLARPLTGRSYGFPLVPNLATFARPPGCAPSRAAVPGLEEHWDSVEQRWHVLSEARVMTARICGTRPCRARVTNQPPRPHSRLMQAVRAVHWSILWQMWHACDGTLSTKWQDVLPSA
jgi:hypothetical protein